MYQGRQFVHGKFEPVLIDKFNGSSNQFLPHVNYQSFRTLLSRARFSYIFYFSLIYLSGGCQMMSKDTRRI
jgi:hypothetical protein